MPLAYLTFFSGIAISVVAIYYSVLGLASIFAAAVIPIIIMGTILEVSKLVTAWWLKANWHRAPWSMKIYLTIAVITLMLITSMGIFGFLSKAHTDQAVPLGDTASQVAFIDEKINNERETISNARSLIKQLDDAVIGIQSGDGREIKQRDGSVRTQSASEYALQVRRSQANDRAALTKTIEEAQSRIVKLQEEKAPIASQLRAVEAEVGPIKYIAKLIYGDNPDQNILEKAVVWVIIIIVLVFDPLAVLLLLASQMSFQWARKSEIQNPDHEHVSWPFNIYDKERKDELVQEKTPQERTGEEIPSAPQSVVGSVDEGSGGQQQQDTESQIRDEAEEANRKIAEIEKEIIEPEVYDEDLKIRNQVLDDAKQKLEQFISRLETASIKTPTFEKDIKEISIPKISQEIDSPVIESKKLDINLPSDESYTLIDGIEAWNNMIDTLEKKIEEEKNSSKIYVQNEEQVESNLWQESRKNVVVEEKDSMSQEDYQKKVHQAIIRDLIKNINEGVITITDLTEDEIKNIEEYLKENDDRENNSNKPS